jgi:hypothetical protein
VFESMVNNPVLPQLSEACIAMETAMFKGIIMEEIAKVQAIRWGGFLSLSDNHPSTLIRTTLAHSCVTGEGT